MVQDKAKARSLFIPGFIMVFILLRMARADKARDNDQDKARAAWGFIPGFIMVFILPRMAQEDKARDNEPDKAKAESTPLRNLGHRQL
jgi:uncharacterized membrane protein YadS